MTQTNDLNQTNLNQPQPILYSEKPIPGVYPYLHLGKDREEQIKINQKAIAYIRSLREKQLTEEEAKAAEESWEFVKKIIDENRSRKYFS